MFILLNTDAKSLQILKAVSLVSQFLVLENSSQTSSKILMFWPSLAYLDPEMY